MAKRALFVVLTLVTLLAGLPAEAGKRERDAAIEEARKRAGPWLLERGAPLGVFDPAAQLKETSAEVLSTGVILRYQQMYEGVPVFLANLVLLVTERNIRANSGLVIGIRAEATPTITAREAEAVAIAKRGIKSKPQFLKTTLFVVPRNSLGRGVPDRDYLAWEVSVGTDNDVDGALSRRLLIDAHTSKVLADDDIVVQATYVLNWTHAEGAYFHGSVRAIGQLNNTNNGLRRVYLQDPCYGHGEAITPGDWALRCGQYDATLNVWLADGFGNWVGNADNRYTVTGKPLEFLATTIGDGVLGSSNVRTPAADAISAIERTFDYLFLKFNRVGLDGSNGPQVRALVHVPIGANAQWITQHRAIQLGSGDVDYADATALDIVAHEIGHALSDFGPQLDFGGESGKIAEATSNMFAMLVSENEGTTRCPIGSVSRQRNRTTLEARFRSRRSLSRI